MPKARTFILLFVAFLLAIGAAVTAKKWTESMSTTTKNETIPVVVAVVDVPMYSKINKDQIKITDWSKTNLPPNYISDSKFVIGKISTQIIYTGDVINKMRLHDDTGISPMSALIEPSMRAISLKVNDSTAVSGFLFPGNRVDVLSTTKANNAAQAKTEALVQNVKVLAIDQNVSLDKATIAKTVTLEVTPAQAEILAGATSTSTIQLVLRNPEDTKITEKKVEIAPVETVKKSEVGVIPADVMDKPKPTVIVPPVMQQNKIITVVKGIIQSKVNCTAGDCETLPENSQPNTPVELQNFSPGM